LSGSLKENETLQNEGTQKKQGEMIFEGIGGLEQKIPNHFLVT